MEKFTNENGEFQVNKKVSKSSFEKQKKNSFGCWVVSSMVIIPACSDEGYGFDPRVGSQHKPKCILTGFTDQSWDYS